jgi:hypothetical protein
MAVEDSPAATAMSALKKIVLVWSAGATAMVATITSRQMAGMTTPATIVRVPIEAGASLDALAAALRSAAVRLPLVSDIRGILAVLHSSDNLHQHCGISNA